jgi:hypothetical protein
MKKDKNEIITFKVPESLRNAMSGIPNRSEFIRNAVMAALESVCPLCKGTGILHPNQKVHWDRFAEGHHISQCGTCDAVHLVCTKHPDDHAHDTDVQ